MVKKLTQEDFLNKSKEVHGDTYDYSKAVYVAALKKVQIVCKEHGDFEQAPARHMAGQGCPKCRFTTIGKKLSYTTADFIKAAITVHGDLYDYSQVNYVDNKEKVGIICKKHGEVFSQSPNHHISGKGCAKCGRAKTSASHRKTPEEVIALAKNRHGDRYDYSKMVFKNMGEKISIICLDHGEFSVTPDNHIRLGVGCAKCSIEARKFKAKPSN